MSAGLVLDELVARVESQAAVVDERLSAPAQWWGPLRRERAKRPRIEERARVAEAFNALTEAPERALTVDGLVDLHRRAVGGDGFRTTPVRVGSPDDRRVPCARAGDVIELVTIALGRAASGRERAPLAAARLHLDLMLVHPFADGNGRVGRLAASAVMLAAGYRSTLVTCMEHTFAHDPPAYGASFRRLAEDGDDDAWLGRYLDAMARRTDAVARFRRREQRLRAALLDLGIDPCDHDALLCAFDSDLSTAHLDPRIANALVAVTAPWPVLAPAWGPLAERLPEQLECLDAEEHDDETRAETRSVPGPPRAAYRRPAASIIVPAYRDVDSIVAVLRGVAAQDFDEPFETIVVASGPDATQHVVRRAFPEVVLLASPDRLTPGAARNAGVGVARGEVVAFLAADCVPEPDWLRRRVDAHRAGYALVGGFVDSAPTSTIAGWAQYFAKFWGMQSLHDRRFEGRGPLFHLSYSREVLTRPWDPSPVAGEDTAFNHALVEAGHRVWFDSSIRVRHQNLRDFADVLAEQREQGAAVGALCRDGELAKYATPLRRGAWMPLAIAARGVIAVARYRPRLFGRCLLAFPLTVRAVAARRQGFRSTARPEPEADPVGPVAARPAEVRRGPNVAVDAPPDVSVLVPAYNEERVIAQCLDSLVAQSLSALEIIVVDDGSTDRTAAIAESRGVRVLRVPHSGPALAKNRGATEARGNVVVFFDADLVAEPDAIERLCRPILAGATVGTYTRDFAVANPADPWAECWTLNRGAAPGEHFRELPPAHWENFRAVAREPFVRVGGYDDVGYGEDMTLAPKLQTLAEAVPGARVGHHHPDSLTEIWHNARWIGRGTVLRGQARVFRRYAPWRSVRRGIAGARAIHRPRYVVFAVVYDFGVLSSYCETRLGRRRHAK
jgi:glycosyltransferase involved in cell wall biosynthesis